jgi:chromosome segregation ATPase
LGRFATGPQPAAARKTVRKGSLRAKVEDLHKTVVEVEKLIAGILEQLKQLGKSLDSLNDARAENTQQLSDLRRDCEKEVVALKKDIDELPRWTDRQGTSELKSKLDVLTEKMTKVENAIEKSGTRAWSVVPNVVGAIISGLIAALVAYFVATHK